MSTILGIQLIVYQRGILPTYSSAFQALLVAANDHQQSSEKDVPVAIQFLRAAADVIATSYPVHHQNAPPNEANQLAQL